MVQTGGRPGLAQQPRACLVLRIALGEQLDRDVTVEVFVIGAKHLAHSAHADFADDAEVRELCADHVGRCYRNPTSDHVVELDTYRPVVRIDSRISAASLEAYPLQRVGALP